MTSALSGRLATLSIDGLLLAQSQSFILSLDDEELDLSNRDSNFWKEIKMGVRDWAVSGSGLYIYNDVARKKLDYHYSNRSLATLNVILTMPNARYTMSGKAVLTNLVYPAPHDEAATISFVLDGEGPLTPQFREEVDGFVGEFFRDDFDNGAIGAEWTTDNTDVDRTIAEAGGILTTAIANNANSDWFYNPVGNQLNDAPKAYMTIPRAPIEFITKLNSYTVNDRTHAGIFVALDATGITLNGAYLFGRFNNTVDAGQNGLRANRTTPVDASYIAVTTLPIWLKARIPEVNNSDILFSYSTDGINWTLLHTASTYYQPGYTVGLFAKNWAAGWGNVAAPFEFFALRCPYKKQISASDGNVIAVYEDGNPYTEKTSIWEVCATASTFYFDTATRYLYIHTSDGSDPSGFTIEIEAL